MNPPHERSGWFARKENMTKLLRGLYVVCALAVASEFLVHRHAEVGADGLFGFYALFAFGSSVILVLVARLLRKLVMRSEDYYDA